MDIPWEKLGQDILGILKEKGKKAVEEDLPFWKDQAMELAKLKWDETRETDPGKKKKLRVEMDIVGATTEVRLARVALKAAKEAQATIAQILGVIGKTLASAALSAL